MRTLFVTGSGTGIGKTYVTAALVRSRRERLQTVRAIKPVVTGYPGDGGEDTDTEILLAAQGLDPADAEAVEACSPWRFIEPLSPDMAAAREKRQIDFDALVAFCRDAAETAGEGVLLIEGIGGVMVPLTETHTVLDWMVAVGAPALVVTGSYLGTLSHTLTAVAALQGRNVAVAGIVVSESEESPVPPEETVNTLQRHSGAVPIAFVARGAAPDAVYAVIAGLIGV